MPRDVRPGSWLDSPRLSAALAVVACLLLVAGLTAVAAGRDAAAPLQAPAARAPAQPPPTSPTTEPPGGESPAEPADATEAAPAAPAPEDAAAAEDPADSSAEPPADDGLREITPDEDSAPAPPPTIRQPQPPPPAGEEAAPPADPARTRFEQRFPAQAAATEDPAEPATTRWALLIGINEHHGGTRANIGSRQDAEALFGHLRSLGWREDHIVLLTDLTATREAIEQGIAWLARKTSGESVAIFHYSGHTKSWRSDVDGDGRPDRGLWPADNRYLVDSELVARLAHVRPARLWINFGACHAEGFDDPGLRQAGRVVTFSSREPEKSYEDPSVGRSVWGFYLFEEGMIAGFGDRDGSGDITVQEAFEFAAPRAAQRTAGQRFGAQNPVMHDDLGAPFSLAIPPPPPPPPPPESEPEEDLESPEQGCRLPLCVSNSSSSAVGDLAVGSARLRR